MTHTPRFTDVADGEASENEYDEQSIIGDQDETMIEGDINNLDENMGAKTYSLDTSEDEPEDFMEGELDVKQQMDRTAREIDASVHGRRGPDRDPKGYH